MEILYIQHPINGLIANTSFGYNKSLYLIENRKEI